MGRTNKRLRADTPIPRGRKAQIKINNILCPRCRKKMYLSEEAAKAALERIRRHRMCQTVGESERSYYQCGPAHDFTWEGNPVYHLTHYGS